MKRYSNEFTRNSFCTDPTFFLKGWFWVGTLEDDMDDPRLPPTNYTCFKVGDNYNYHSHVIDTGMEVPDPWNMYSHINSTCQEDNADAPHLCSSMHVLYKYIRSSLFVISPYYDGYSSIGAAPDAHMVPLNEVQVYKEYISMFGKAGIQSMNMIVNGTTLNEKPHPDGVFSASCIDHGASRKVKIEGQD